jgi:hypothetical protein
VGCVVALLFFVRQIRRQRSGVSVAIKEDFARSRQAPLASEKPLVTGLPIVVSPSKTSAFHRNASATFQVFAHHQVSRMILLLPEHRDA